MVIMNYEMEKINTISHLLHSYIFRCLVVAVFNRFHKTQNTKRRKQKTENADIIASTQSISRRQRARVPSMKEHKQHMAPAMPAGKWHSREGANASFPSRSQCEAYGIWRYDDMMICYRYSWKYFPLSL